MNFDRFNKSIHSWDDILLPLSWTRISGCSDAKSFVTLMAMSLRGELRGVTWVRVRVRVMIIILRAEYQQLTKWSRGV